MLIAPLSPIKRNVNLNSTSMEKLKNQYKNGISRLSLHKENSNVDIQAVLEDSRSTSTINKIKGVTSTDFQKANNKMQSTGTIIMLDQNGQSEFNKSHLILKNGVYPPYGFALRQNDQQVLGLIEYNPKKDDGDETVSAESSTFKKINLNDINNGVHPVLLEAYKQARGLNKIKAPIRTQTKRQKFMVLNRDADVTKEQGTFAMTMRSNLTSLRSI